MYETRVMLSSIKRRVHKLTYCVLSFDLDLGFYVFKRVMLSLFSALALFPLTCRNTLQKKVHSYNSCSHGQMNGKTGRTCEKHNLKALSGCMCLKDETNTCLKLIMRFHSILREWILKAWENSLVPNGLHFKQAISVPIFSMHYPIIAITILIQHCRQIQMTSHYQSSLKMIIS